MHDEKPWINPVGGLGDMLMVSGVLKILYDRRPSKQFNLVRRTSYVEIFKDHPIIDKIGFPDRNSKVVSVDYWSMEELGPGNQRPFQVLARAFGLSTPVEEKLYISDNIPSDSHLYSIIPWKNRNVIIAPSSDSPRKMMAPEIWHKLVDHLLSEEMLVMQVGRLGDQRIRNAYSLLGLTTPRQLIALLGKCDVVITSDNFIMHAAHMAGVRTVAIWGPTHSDVYGYPDQIHIQLPKMCEPENNEDCIGPSRNQGGRLYGTPCPLGNRHCIDQIKPAVIFESVKEALKRV